MRTLLQKLFILLFVMGGFHAIAQSDKKLQKTITVYGSDAGKGINLLKKYIDKEDVARPEAWDLYVEMHENIYNNVIAYNASVDVNMLTPFEVGMLQGDAEIALYHLIEACREASLKGRSVRADANIRNMFLNYDPDTSYLDTSAYKITNEVYAYLNNMQANVAKPILDSIIVDYPESFNLNMCYYLYYTVKEKTDSAIMYLKKTIEYHPDHTIPRENLAQMLYTNGNVYRAKEQIEELMVRYPGEDVKAYYKEILFIENNQLDDHRLLRGVYPNQIGATYEDSPSDHWKDYRESMLKVYGFTSPDGIIKKNDITKHKYLELYSWEQMLEKNKSNKPEELSYAYEMQEKGFLDCYVLFSNFHVDFAAQVVDYSKSKENREHMMEYIKKHCVKKIEK